MKTNITHKWQWAIVLLFSINIHLMYAQAGWNQLGLTDKLNSYSNFRVIVNDAFGNTYAAGDLVNSRGNYYVAKWDGTSWTELGGNNSLGANGPINALYVDAVGNVYAAGNFTNASGHRYLAWYTGVTWVEAGGNNSLAANGEIKTICASPITGYVYCAGDFTNAAGKRYVAQWTGTWSELGGFDALSANSTILSLCSDPSGNIYAAGNFKNPSNRQYVAKFATSTWSELPAINAPQQMSYINSICSDPSGNIFAAGAFVNLSGKYFVAKWDNTWWSEVDAASMNANAPIVSICTDNLGGIYAAGAFTTPAGNRRVMQNLGSTWGEVGGDNSLAASAQINSICVNASFHVFAAGAFVKSSNFMKYIAKYTSAGWAELGANLGLDANNQIYSMCKDAAGNIYAAGGFTNADGKFYVAKWNGTAWSELGGINALNANSIIRAICSDAAGNIYAAGNFGNNFGSKYVAKWNGTAWAPLGSGLGFSNINTLCSDPDGNIYAAGGFTNNMGSQYVAKWNGSAWSELGGTNGLAANSPINTICSDVAGNIFAAGLFTNGSGKNYVARYSANNEVWAEVGLLGGLAANANIKSLCALAGSGVYAAGDFTNASGKRYVAIWSGAEWEEVGSLNALSANNTINAVCGDGAGHIYAAGSFTNAGGKRYVAEWNGTAWSEVGGMSNFAPSDFVASLLTDATGKLYAAGNFKQRIGDFCGVEYRSSPCSSPITTITASATTICAGSAVTLSGNGATTYVWSGGVSNGVAFYPSNTAAYTVTGTNGCGSSNAAITITVNPRPTVGITVAPFTSVCRNTAVTLSGVGADTYSWSGGISNNVPFSATVAASYTVTGTNANGCSNTFSTAISLLPATAVPTRPSVISGPIAGLCPSGIATATYSVSPIASVSSFTWLVPSGASIVSGQGTNVISVSFGPLFISGVISVKSNNTCNSSSARTLTVKSIPASPASLAGLSGNLCPAGVATATYSTTAVSGATSYTWVAPSGSSILSGQGTTSVNVAFSSLINGDIITVAANNACGSSLEKELILRTTPPKPGNINGHIMGLCPTSIASATYSVAPVAAATPITYNWVPPVGATITAGQGTNRVTLNFSNTFLFALTGTLSVTASNDCGTSAAKTLVLRSVTAKPGVISGPTVGLCPDGIATATYSITPVFGAAYYTWTPPMGASIVSGQNTNVVTVSFSSAFVGDNIIVAAHNDCGYSQERSLLLKPEPNKPGAIAGPTQGLCPTGISSATYSVAPVAGATSYAWGIPSGTYITGPSSTNSINLNFLPSFTGNAYLNVYAVTECGYSIPSRILLNSLPANAGGIGGLAYSVCNQSKTYAVNPVAGATYYLWTPPAGATITSGQGSTAIVCAFGNSFTSGLLKVKAGNACGFSQERSLAIVGTPLKPGFINGPTTGLCPAGEATATYNITAMEGATYYTWVSPPGTTIISTNNTTSVTLSFSSAFTSGNLSVTANNDCGSSLPNTLALQSTPNTPGTIVGQTIGLCAAGESSATYSINPVFGATGYSWTAPAGATINGSPTVFGANLTSVTVTFGSGFTSGNLSVKAFNYCGESAAKTLALKSVLAAPGNIAGPTVGLCASGISSAVYSIAPVAGATAYTWTAPAGANINGSPTITGANLTSVTVTFTSGFSAGNLSVKAVNYCGEGPAKNLALKSTLPAPGNISAGTTTGLCPSGVSSATYSILNVAGATGYTWTAPPGATILSGQNTTSVWVEFSNTFTSGLLLVQANNACGVGPAKTLYLVSSPATPGAITGTSACANRTGVTYSVTPVAGTTYNWTVPVGAVITAGNSTNAITVDYGPFIGQVTVTASNACGTSQARVLNVTFNCLSPLQLVSSEEEEEQVQLLSASVYPNPTVNEINIEFTADVDKMVVVELYDILGNKVMEQKQQVVSGTSILTSSLDEFTKGVYLLRVLDSEGNNLYKTNVVKQ
jgi:hypothetical protein